MVSLQPYMDHVRRFQSTISQEGEAGQRLSTGWWVGAGSNEARFKGVTTGKPLVVPLGD